MDRRSFRKVSTMLDDAITVRIRPSDDTIIGILDFPPFSLPSGKLLKSETLPVLNAQDALTQATKMLAVAPFGEVVVVLSEGTQWQDEWGSLV